MIVTGSRNLTYRTGGVTGSGNLYYGFGPQAVNFGASITGILRPTYSGSTSIPDESIFLQLPQGLGIVGVSGTPNPGIVGYINGQPPSNTVSGSIVGVATLPLLYASIRGFYSESGTLSGVSYRASFSGSDSLGSWVFPTSSGDAGLPGFIRPMQSGSADLPGYIQPVPPVPLYATINPQSVLTLTGNVYGIPPAELGAMISGQFYSSLSATMEGYDQSDISATITGNSLDTFDATITGFAEGSDVLYFEINADRLYRLFCTISGFAEGEAVVSAAYEAIPPEALDATIYPIPPAPIEATITGVHVPEQLPAQISGYLADYQIQASISSTGGFIDLFAFIKSATAAEETITASIDGAETGGLGATINIDPQHLLSASITPSGPYASKYLYTYIHGVCSSDLQATISPADPPKLEASYSPILGHTLQASIYPDVFYIDTVIPINTYAKDDLSAKINADICDARSFSHSLGASITPIFKEDLSAYILGAHNLVKTADLLPIKFTKKAVETDFLRLNIDSPAIAIDALPITILNVPFTDLTASIVGIPPSADLSASITPTYLGSYFTADPSEGIYANTLTGEKKIIRFFFTLSGKTFYYSEVANKTFPENLLDTIYLVVETHDEIDEDADLSPTMLAQKTSVRQCIVSDLTPFTSWDEAVQYGIRCAAGMFSDLSATITAVGGYDTVLATILPIDTDTLADLPAVIMPSDRIPTLDAQITATGGFVDLPEVFIRGIVSDQTEQPTELPGVLGPQNVPLVITFSGSNPQIVLQELQKPVTIVYSSLPDLNAYIFGQAVDGFSATVSGTI